jgi:hypothetical protein
MPRSRSNLLLIYLLLCLSVSTALPMTPQAEPTPVAAEPSAAQVEPAVAQRLREALGYGPAVPDDATDKLREILADPKYAGETLSSTPATWLERFLDWMGRMFKGTGLPLGNGWIAAGTGLVMLAVLYLVIRITWELLQRRVPRGRSNEAASAEEMSAAALLAAASAAAARGDFRSAVRLRFIALVKELGLPAASWQTNSQLVRHVRKLASSAAPPFSAAASRYEEIWYGGAASSIVDYETLQARAGEVLAALPRTATEGV